MTRPAFAPLHELGDRICILGPSNAGKSSLAHTIGNARDLPVIHLDLLHHLPDTDWVPRPKDAFLRLHDEAVAGARWVMDGNYSMGFDKRLTRATGIILIATPRLGNFGRYLRRTLLRTQRHGALSGAKDSLKWPMMRHILVVQPANLKRYPAMLAPFGLPQVTIGSMRDLNRLYKAWGLTR